jgi:hypothetical protein
VFGSRLGQFVLHDNKIVLILCFLLRRGIDRHHNLRGKSYAKPKGIINSYRWYDDAPQKFVTLVSIICIFVQQMIAGHEILL